MKKLTCILLALVLLSGCSAGAGEQVPSQIIQLPTDSVSVTAAPTTAAPVSLDMAEYEIVLEDRSIRNANGDVLIEVSYEKVVLLGDVPEWQQINTLIQADCADFLTSNQESLFGTVEDTEEILHSMGMNYGDLFCTISAEVAHNANGLFSIHKSMGWFMGGVFNAENFGLTFDLRTGEAVTLESLSQLPPEEFEQQLKDIASHWLRETYGEGLFGPPEEVLGGYGLEDLMFYIENGQIILTFPTYTFAAGAAGSSVIPTGIMVG